jgi:hypothetical protein
MSNCKDDDSAKIMIMTMCHQKKTNLSHQRQKAR